MINTSVHPDYQYNMPSWTKFRFIEEGGDAFINEYLVKYSEREDDTRFNARRDMTPIPGFAAAAIIDIKNSIFQRMTDTSRSSGSKLFQQTMAGELGGVDLKGADMNYFIGSQILLELLFLGKVGVYVDMPNVDLNATLKESKKQHPYYYAYVAEDIRNWRFSVSGDTTEFDMLLLRERVLTYDDYNLPAKDYARYRLLTKEEGGVAVRFYDAQGEQVDTDGKTATEPIFLDIPKIPFALFELNQSLLTNIANHQIALLNLESSDVAYALLANFPRYVEQQNKMVSPHLKSEEDSGGTESNARQADIGGTTGRSYAHGLNPPQFIHPSSEPLKASIDKQTQLKDDIRQLVQLALSALQPKFASARSKEFDQQGLEAGLSYIGLVLEHGEQQLASIYSSYEQENNEAKISYPLRYSLKSDIQRIDEAERLQTLMLTVPTRKGQKVTSKLIVRKLFDDKLTQSELEELLNEIEQAAYVTTDPEIIHSDLEKGLVSTKTASTARGYEAEKEVKQAKIDHAERIARIQSAQARGLPDLDSETNSGVIEKENSQNADIQENSSKATRN